MNTQKNRAHHVSTVWELRVSYSSHETQKLIKASQQHTNAQM